MFDPSITLPGHLSDLVLISIAFVQPHEEEGMSW
jgi:hypothetical protein